MKNFKLTKITFIDYASKECFIKQNAICDTEVASETPGSIDLIEPIFSTVNWINNGFVYSVTSLGEYSS